MTILNDQNHPARQCISHTEKIAVCRCWKSKKFPFCDGSHNAYNAASGDSLGPLIVEKSDKDA